LRVGFVRRMVVFSDHQPPTTARGAIRIAKETPRAKVPPSSSLRHAETSSDSRNDRQDSGPHPVRRRVFFLICRSRGLLALSQRVSEKVDR
jgi:hypothetical protein